MNQLVAIMLLSSCISMHTTSYGSSDPSVFEAFKRRIIESWSPDQVDRKKADYLGSLNRFWDNSSVDISTSSAHNFTLPKHRDGFFCIQERKIEKKSGTALRMRIGTLEDVDRLEGKGRPY
jgi:hypothetical protein